MKTQFKMVRINLDQFAILADSLNAANISYTIGLSFSYALQAKRVACFMNLEFYADNEKLFILKMNCEFEIHPDNWNTFISENRISIPKSLLEYLAVHTVGTARGILFSKTEGTPFNSLILPPVDVASMITQGIDEEIRPN